MNLPSTNTDGAFERLLQELPEDNWDRAIEFKAFTRASKIKTPAQLLQGGAVRLPAGSGITRDHGPCHVVMEERIRDTGIHKRMQACLSWVKVLLKRWLRADATPLLEAGYALWWWTARGNRGRERTGPGIGCTSRWIGSSCTLFISR
ncbi:MAG: hypothetical protein ACFCVA_00380 [Gammaproteobacteria bacterium]